MLEKSVPAMRSDTSPEQQEKARRLIVTLLASGPFAIVLGALWAYLSISGLVHMMTARIVLTFAWVVAVLAIIISSYVWGRPVVHRIRIGLFSAIILALAAYGLDYWTVRHRPILVAAKEVNDEHHDTFAREFRLGYKLFGLANRVLLPFQGEAVGFMVHWERQNYSYTDNGSIITLHLPDIDIQPNITMYGTTVLLPEEIGNGITFRLDPKSFQHGAAIMSNIFERTERQAGVNETEPTGGARLLGFPANKRIVYIMQSTVRWGKDNYYQLGEAGEMGDSLKVTGGVLGTSNANVFNDALLIRGNRFIGGPRGGYSFPKAETVIGNDFSESIFDASRLPDNAVIANNRFASANGTYQIGPQPEVCFVVKIVKTKEYSTVLLFGAKPDVGDEP